MKIKWKEARAARRNPEAVRLTERRIGADSKVTRLLCAGTHLDAKFCGQVINELVKQKHRRTAPSYGYDCVAVLAHALHARRRRRIRAVALLAVIIPLALSTFDVFGLGIQWLLLAVWWAWMVVLVDRLMTVHLLIQRLNSFSDESQEQETASPVSVDGHRSEAPPVMLQLPYHRLLADRAKQIVKEQCDSRVYYSGYVPFVGAGALTRSWSFSIVLEEKGDQSIEEFTPEELMEVVRRNVEEKLSGADNGYRRIHGLTVERRWYQTYWRDTPPDSGETPQIGGAVGEDYNSAREYLCVNVASWAEELVTSIFVGFDIKGDVLHTELHSYVLLPIKEAFHEVDRLPRELTTGEVLALAVNSPLAAVMGIFKAVSGKVRAAIPEQRGPRGASLVRSIALLVSVMPSVLITLLILSNSHLASLWTIVLGLAGLWAGLTLASTLWRWQLRRREERKQQEHNNRATGAQGKRIIDYGARTSIRDLAASDEPHHFFQSVDQDKYTKIIERRVTDFIKNFLDEKKVRIDEFEARRQVVFNYGIMQTGGQFNNAGAMTAGASSSAITITDPI